MNLRHEVKKLEAIVSLAKPGENVSQEEYDIMQTTLKMAREMQKLHCSAMIISQTVFWSLVGTLVVKYGYDFDLGLKIELCTVPLGICGIVADGMIIKNLKAKLAKADAQVKKLKEINLSKRFR